MDFQGHIKYLLPTGAPMPFFMAYPDYCKTLMCERSGEEAARDFEYLRQMYPKWVSKYRQRVEELLDRMDYEGSMIYDEFPDRLSLYEITDTVTRCILREDGAAAISEETFPQVHSGSAPAEGEAAEDSFPQVGSGSAQVDGTAPAGDTIPENSFPKVGSTAPSGSEATDSFRGLIQVLVCNEIYRRRQRGERIKR